MGSPSQLTKEQVKMLRQKDADKAIERYIVHVNISGDFEKQLDIRQNDAILIKIKLAK